MGIRDDFKPYTDQYGLIQPNKGGSSGNGLLYTAEYIMAVRAHGALSEAERQRLIAIYKSCYMRPGLFNRFPGCKDQEGPDDYIGIGVASRFLNADIAAEVLNYGRRGASFWSETETANTFWSKALYKTLSIFGLKRVPFTFCNVDPGGFTESAWLGRQADLTCHLEFAAGVKPTLYRKLWWIGSILAGMFTSKTNYDSWILSWLMIRTAGNQSWICSIAGKIYMKKFAKVWPNGVGELMGAYFNDPTHPSAVWLMGVY